MKIKDIILELQKGDPEQEGAIYYDSGIRADIDDVWISANGYAVIATQVIKGDKEESMTIKHEQY